VSYFSSAQQQTDLFLHNYHSQDGLQIVKKAEAFFAMERSEMLIGFVNVRLHRKVRGSLATTVMVDDDVYELLTLVVAVRVVDE